MTRVSMVLLALATWGTCLPLLAAEELAQPAKEVKLPAVGRAVDLQTAWQAALAADPTLASASANRDVAAENIAITRARLLPQVSLQSINQRLQQTTEGSGVTSDFSGRSINTQLMLRQGVYRPRDRIGLEIATRQAELGELGLVQAKSDLWMRTAWAWVDVLAAQSQRELHTRMLQAGTVWVDQENARFRSGEGTRDAVAEATAQRASMKSRLTETGLDLQGKLQAFDLLTHLGATDITNHRLTTSPGLLGEPEEGLIERMLASNPELAAARANEAVSDRRLAQVGADHLPTLDIVGGASKAQNDSTTTLGTRYRNWQLGLHLVIPIYSGGGVDASQRQATAALTAAAADRAAVVQRLRTQFASHWNAQAGLRERWLGAQELVLAAREQRRATELSVMKGLKTRADLSHLESLLAQRESDVVDVISQILKKQAQLLSLLPTSDPAWNRWAQSFSGGR